MKGATENVLQVCSHILVDGTLQPLTSADKDNILNGVRDKENRGMRSSSSFYDFFKLDSGLKISSATVVMFFSGVHFYQSLVLGRQHTFNAYFVLGRKFLLYIHFLDIPLFLLLQLCPCVMGVP